jgi:hypothetical protein
MKATRRVIVITLICSTTVGCASMGVGEHWNPIVDSQSLGDRTEADASKDLADCRSYARRVDVNGQALAGVLLGGLLGAAIGAPYGNRSMWAGAQGGATGGIMAGTGNAMHTQTQVIRNCMLGRSYRVLN